MIAKEDYLKALDIVNQYHEQIQLQIKNNEYYLKTPALGFLMYLQYYSGTIPCSINCFTRIKRVLTTIMRQDLFVEDLTEDFLKRLKNIGAESINAILYFTNEYLTSLKS